MNYDYVRNYYHVPARVGGRVSMGDKRGTIGRCTSGQYVHVKFDGAKFTVPVHHTDLVYDDAPEAAR